MMIACLKFESEAAWPAASYFAAEKRLSNELAETIGWAPATSPSLGGGADESDAVRPSATAVFGAGRWAACLVAAGFGGSLCLASATFGFAGAGDGGGGGVAPV